LQQSPLGRVHLNAFQGGLLPAADAEGKIPHEVFGGIDEPLAVENAIHKMVPGQFVKGWFRASLLDSVLNKVLSRALNEVPDFGG